NNRKEKELVLASSVCFFFPAWCSTGNPSCVWHTRAQALQIHERAILGKLDPSSMDIIGRAKEDVSLPKATMTKIIKEMLPRHVRVARDAQDLLVECCVEFINLISSESNEICSREDKRTIAPEHVMKALEVLGFGDYLEEVHLALEEHRREALDSPKSSGRWGKDGMGMTEEEAVAEQQRMFAEARERMLSGSLPTPKQEGDQA
ncbi:hypothetical protein GOP47_0002816, partial [Adiantum capillus-veneris]